MYQSKNTAQRLASLGTLFITIIILMPFIPLIISSLAFRWQWPDLLPAKWWWQQREISPIPLSWDYLISPSSQLGEAIANTMLIGLSASALTLAICFPAALIAAKRESTSKFWHAFSHSFSNLPLFLPEISLGIPLVILAIHTNLQGSYIVIVLAHCIPASPYVFRLLIPALNSHGNELEDHASMLGASKAQTLRHVTLPILTPIFTISFLMAFLVSTNLFLITFLLGQGKITTLTTLLFSHISGGALTPVASGIAIISILPGLLTLFIITAGAKFNNNYRTLTRQKTRTNF
ncbi:ABC transporter permease [Polycladidibacter stylochi]|uniref:ABC transporter permease n=1 Tax=Polycladidibacter stylochi TaxID=1807766 RepID=UPI0008351603|nr:ABC transporter permease subunit [Pseudovibrio stylochi]